MADPARILVVDDERATRVTLAEILELEGYEVTAVGGGQEAVTRMEKESFDLLLTDLRMPDMDGLEVVAAARQLAPKTVIILLTAHATLDSAIHALRQGAHDYLLKPARAAQIIQSVRAGLEKRAESERREKLLVAVRTAVGQLSTANESAEQPGEIRFLQAHGFTVDRFKRSVSAAGRTLDLTRVEYELLVMLIHNIDQVLSCTEMVRQIQGYEADDSEARAIVRVHMSRLRQKIEAAGVPPLPIVNVRGVGYRLSR
jgi:two-component system KDP operon response regulator KdpE